MALKGPSRQREEIVTGDAIRPVEAPNSLDRRALLKAAVVAGVVLVFGNGKPAKAQDTETLQDPGKRAGGDLNNELEHLPEEPMSLVALDAVGFACFIDAVQSMARQKDSGLKSLVGRLKGILTSASDEHDENSEHKHPFPHSNMAMALTLNLIRMVAYDEDVSQETVHELETTFIGVALLMGLTSLGKSIIEAEREAGELAHSEEEAIIAHPMETIGESIFQLTWLAAATQLPLTAFGNAKMGNGEFGEVEMAFKVGYEQWGKVDETFSRASLESQHASGEIKKFNPVISKNIGVLLGRSDLKDDDSALQTALTTAAHDHTNDLMVILMSTSCNDSQAAMGDAGPLVGLIQSYGLDGLKAIPAVLPYTLLIAMDRSAWAAKRAGVPLKMVMNSQRWAYMKKFIATTWKNLAHYFIHLGPEIRGKFNGNIEKKRAPATGPGRDFDIVTQTIEDMVKVGSAVFDAIRTEKGFDVNNLKEAIVQLTMGKDHFDKIIGRVARHYHDDKVQDASTIESVESKDRLQSGASGKISAHEYQDADVQAHGEMADDPSLRMMQEKVRAMSYPPENQAALEEMIEAFKTIRDKHGPEILRELLELSDEQQAKPSLKAVALLMRKKPNIAKLVDFHYWKERIGPALAETMFVVFLQGLHLSFIINTLQRAVYGTDKFKSLPLAAQEFLSVLMNNFISMFADNWADCVVHSKWLTKMYFTELNKDILTLSEKYADSPDMLPAIEAFSHDDDAKKIISERYSVHRQEFAALIRRLLDINESSSLSAQQKLVNQDELLVLHGKHLDNTENFYWKSMVMSLVTAVTGGGKALTGNSPHFTFAAGKDDYTLATTLADLKNHWVYHLWEFCFSFVFSTQVAPAYSRILFTKQLDKEARDMLEGRFMERFPDFKSKLEELERLEQQNSPAEAGR